MSDATFHDVMVLSLLSVLYGRCQSALCRRFRRECVAAVEVKKKMYCETNTMPIEKYDWGTTTLNVATHTHNYQSKCGTFEAFYIRWINVMYLCVLLCRLCAVYVDHHRKLFECIALNCIESVGCAVLYCVSAQSKYVYTSNIHICNAYTAQYKMWTHTHTHGWYNEHSSIDTECERTHVNTITHDADTIIGLL